MILATPAGMRGYAGFVTWAAMAPPEVLARPGIGSDTRVRTRFVRCSHGWVRQNWTAAWGPTSPLLAAENGVVAVAVDGKTLRGARRIGAAAADLVAVFAHRAPLVLGQLTVAEKSNEIPRARMLLRLFGTQRLLVTIDLMPTHTATARLICATLKSQYLMIVKSEQPRPSGPPQGGSVEAGAASTHRDPRSGHNPGPRPAP